MPALQFKIKTTAKEIWKQQKTKLRGKDHCALCQHKACTRSLSPPALPEQAWPKARDYLLLQKRELSGTEECDKRRRECAGMESSLPVPPTRFLIIYLNQTSYWQLGQRAKAKAFTFQTIMQNIIESSHTEFLCIRFTFLHSPVRTQEKSILQLKSNKAFSKRHHSWLF